MKYLLILVLLFLCYDMTQSKAFTTYSSTLSFNEDIKPIFKKRCAECHNKNTGLPDITKYETALELRTEIKQKVKTREMPYFGGMTESERDMIINWANFGSKE